jgi:hypothetical protein
MKGHNTDLIYDDPKIWVFSSVYFFCKFSFIERVAPMKLKMQHFRQILDGIIII